MARRRGGSSLWRGRAAGPSRRARRGRPTRSPPRRGPKSSAASGARGSTLQSPDERRRTSARGGGRESRSRVSAAFSSSSISASVSEAASALRRRRPASIMPPPRRGDEPALGIGGDALRGPGRQRRRECVGQRVLCARHVAVRRGEIGDELAVAFARGAGGGGAGPGIVVVRLRGRGETAKGMSRPPFGLAAPVSPDVIRVVDLVFSTALAPNSATSELPGLRDRTTRPPNPAPVTPANAGVQAGCRYGRNFQPRHLWTPAFAGVTRRTTAPSRKTIAHRPTSSRASRDALPCDARLWGCSVTSPRSAAPRSPRPRRRGSAPPRRSRRRGRAPRSDSSRRAAP